MTTATTIAAPASLCRTVPGPIGLLRLVSDGTAITELEMLDASPSDGDTGACPVLEQAIAELEEYFAGKRRKFDVPLKPKGTEFQQRVWTQLQGIPYGQTISYRELATRVGDPKAVRAVGMANGRNPIGLIIPCHRVIGADGSLVGYSGGLDRKKALLALEQGSGSLSTGTNGPGKS
jgi:methylated-DNA-[protein]-cysteine S-methyltransferase